MTTTYRRRLRAARPTPRHLHHVDFLRMERGLDRAQDRIFRRYKVVQERQIRWLVARALPAIREQNFRAIRRLNIPARMRRMGSQAFVEPLMDLYRQGIDEVLEEMRASRLNSSYRIALQSPLDPSEEELVALWLANRATVVADGLVQRLEGSAKRNSLDMIRRGDHSAPILRASLTTLADTVIKRESQQVVSEALNLGRDAAARRNEAAIAKVEYSSVLDNQTCDQCHDADKRRFTYGSAAMRDFEPPYRRCSGFGNPRCRCVYVYILEGETAPRR